MTYKQSISDLSGLSEKSQQMLAQAGITTVEQLQHLGSIETYVRVKRMNTSVSLNLLWGIESALTGEHWRDIAKKHRISLLLALAEREENA